MPADDFYKKNEAVIRRTVSYYARKIIRLSCFGYMTIEDLQQELFCEIWKSLSYYDASKSMPSTYLDRILRKRSLTVIYRYQSEKRGGKGYTTLSLSGREKKTEGFYEIQPPDPIFTEESMLSQIEIRRAMKGFTEEQLRLCRDIQSANMTEIAKRKGCSRASLYREIDEMKAQLGPIENYLPEEKYNPNSG